MPDPIVAHMPVRKLTRGPRFHWFGYYDKLQFDPTGTKILGMEVGFEHRSPRANDEIRIGMIDTADGDRWTDLGSSSAWCWQQGCMLQWRPGSAGEVLWNDRGEDGYVCHILDTATGKRRTIPSAVYTVSPDGRTALATDFRRVNDTRPGYGYAGPADPNAECMAPDDSGIWRVDLETGRTELIVSLAQAAAIASPHADLATAKHWFNHLLFSPDGSRFVWLHRWRADRGREPKWRTRMFSANPDGSDMRLVTHGDGQTISHFIWRDARALNIWLGCVQAFALVPDDGSGRAEPILRRPDGHQTYLPGDEGLIYDAYPDRRRAMLLLACHLPTGREVELGRFASPPEYAGEWRCDLHPRHSPDGRRLTIDSVHEADGRQLYEIDLAPLLA